MVLSVGASNGFASAIGLSGMKAAQRQLDSSAHNLANAQTPGFVRQTVVQTAQPGNGGVEAQLARTPERLVAQDPALNAPAPPTGIQADDVVNQTVSLYSFLANLRTVQTEDRMLGSLLNTKA